MKSKIVFATAAMIVLCLHSSYAAANYEVTQVDNETRTATITPNGSLHTGDTLLLVNKNGKCNVQVLSVKVETAVVSLAECSFAVAVADLVINMQGTTENIDTGRYILGGALGSVIGLGIGHAVQGRWKNGHGWFFTFAEIAAAIGGMFPMCRLSEENDMHSKPYEECMRKNERKKRPWQIAFWLIRGMETVSVWWPPTSLQRKPVQARSSVIPIFETKGAGLQLAVSF